MNDVFDQGFDSTWCHVLLETWREQLYWAPPTLKTEQNWAALSVIGGAH